MSDGVGLIVAIAVGGLLFLVGRQLYRRWTAGKKADKLLEEVLRGKDAFRR